MKRALCLGFATVTLAAIATLASAVLAQVRPNRVTPLSPAGSIQARQTLDAYCVGCHNSKAKAAGLALDEVNLNAVHEHADVWEKTLRKLRGRQMPPPGSRQPQQSEIDAFVSWMEASLDG